MPTFDEKMIKRSNSEETNFNILFRAIDFLEMSF